MHLSDPRFRGAQQFCCPCSSRAYGDGSEVAGGSSAGSGTAMAFARGNSTGKSILLGVITGVTVWVVTRTLDGAMRR